MSTTQTQKELLKGVYAVLLDGIVQCFIIFESLAVLMVLSTISYLCRLQFSELRFKRAIPLRALRVSEHICSGTCTSDKFPVHNAMSSAFPHGQLFSLPTFRAKALILLLLTA